MNLETMHERMVKYGWILVTIPQVEWAITRLRAHKCFLVKTEEIAQFIAHKDHGPAMSQRLVQAVKTIMGESVIGVRQVMLDGEKFWVLGDPYSNYTVATERYRWLVEGPPSPPSAIK